MFAPLEKGYLTQGFNLIKTKERDIHYGIDLGWWRIGLVNPPIRAWADGFVIASYFMNGGGNTIVIRHELSQWFQTRYVHLHERHAKVGDVVRKGQIIGLGGNTGNSTGPHLHFEVLQIPTGYKAFSYGDRVKYALDPLKVTFFTEVTGTGVQKMTEIFDKLPLAIPKFDNVLMRSTPAILVNNRVGHVPVGGLRYFGEVVANGLTWAILKHNDQKVYAAIKDQKGNLLLEIKVNTVIKEVIKVVEKIVEVEKPINLTLSQDGVTVKIVKG
jgi:murein DD-endopeptidase MepM/ murein hydrolase activator NlpD